MEELYANKKAGFMDKNKVPKLYGEHSYYLK